jgi:deoxyribodipyrimidine photo-lyase
MRRDLRLSDQAALAAATRQSAAVAVVFVFDTAILGRLKDKDDKRVTFIHQSLKEIDRTLRSKGSRLVVCHGDPAKQIPVVAKALKAQAVFTNQDYEPSAKKRDAAVESALQKIGVSFHTFKDQVIFEGDDIKTGSGTPFKVFTPYKRAWLEAFHPGLVREETPDLKRLMPNRQLRGGVGDWSLRAIGFRESPLWLTAGENAAHHRLKKFTAHVDGYKTNRDIPARPNGTSGLSVHLRFGTISIREAVRFALTKKSPGRATWLSELIWRDFYQMILDRNPHVVAGAFKKQYDGLRWPGGTKWLNAWKEGQTGYPLVDAAMRHFAKTGWMHNRLRMVVASFLTKDLLVDWKRGEAWFAQKLLDFDLAANNGGWQWAASTGCDAQPYFRIFNPVSQSLKFDPQGKFIRAHVPELGGFSDKRIHWPHEAPVNEQNDAKCRLGRDYPSPIVDHGVQRIKCLAMFKKGVFS